jgi:Spy/CpxP family protein refolding chaperone
MLGFILGAACVIGVGRMLRRRAWHNRFGYGGHGACGGPGDYSGYGSGYGTVRRGPRAARWALRSLFERLETTPGQERAILSALDELRENRKVVREELKQTKGDLARAIEGGLIDDASLEESFARHDRLLAQLRVGFVEALKKMTEALDEPQRKQLAQWLEGGFFRRGWGGSGEGVWA